MDQKPETTAVGESQAADRKSVVVWTGPFFGCPEGAAWMTPPPGMKWESHKEMGLSEDILVKMAIECGKWWLTNRFRGTIFSQKLLCKWYMQVILGSSFLVQYHWHWYSVFSHVLLHKTHASLAAPTYHHLPFLAWTSPTIVGATGPLCRLDGHYKGQLRLGKAFRLRKIIMFRDFASTCGIFWDTVLGWKFTVWKPYPIFGPRGNPRIRDGDCHERTARILDHQTMVGSWGCPWMIISHISRVVELCWTVLN